MDEHRPRPATVDGIVLRKVVKTSSGVEGEILLVKRAKDPHAGEWALPGGFMEFGENAEQAVAREVLEETAVRVRPVKMTGTYSSPERDVRQTVSTAFLCEYVSGDAKGGDDAGEARWYLLSWLPQLAFDHDEILRDALKQV